MSAFFIIIGVIGAIFAIALIGFAFKLFFIVLKFIFSFLLEGVLCFICPFIVVPLILIVIGALLAAL